MPVLISTQTNNVHGTNKVFLKIESGYRKGEIINHPRFNSTQEAEAWATETGYTLNNTKSIKGI